MQKLCVVSDTPGKAATIRRQLDGIFDLQFLDFDRIDGVEPPRYLLVDIDFGISRRAVQVKQWLERKPKRGKVIFVVDRTSHLQLIQATALGATGILHRPVERDALIERVLGE
jgi:DNA-binding response OmpR family regulator